MCQNSNLTQMTMLFGLLKTPNHCKKQDRILDDFQIFGFFLPNCVNFPAA
jgi:hypothetical protein